MRTGSDLDLEAAWFWMAWGPTGQLAEMPLAELRSYFFKTGQGDTSV